MSDWVAPNHESAASHWQTRAELAEAEVDRLRPIVQHIAGLVSQDEQGYSQIHRTLIEGARNVVGSPFAWAHEQEPPDPCSPEPHDPLGLERRYWGHED